MKTGGRRHKEPKRKRPERSFLGFGGDESQEGSGGYDLGWGNAIFQVIDEKHRPR